MSIIITLVEEVHKVLEVREGLPTELRGQEAIDSGRIFLFYGEGNLERRDKAYDALRVAVNPKMIVKGEDFEKENRDFMLEERGLLHGPYIVIIRSKQLD